MNNFILAKYEITMQAGERGLSLPLYKGSTLRGGFGGAFKKISCSMRESQCRTCLLKLSCPYAYIFETAPPPGAEALRNYESVPRPFVLEPPLETKTDYGPGETLRFNLILIGRAIGYLPYFIVAFRELGEMGIGRQRKKFRLAEIRAVSQLSGESRTVYHAGDHLVRNVDLSLRINAGWLGWDKPVHSSFYLADDMSKQLPGAQDQKDEAIPGYVSKTGRLELEFQTMTRVKYEENYVHRVEFHMLIRALLRRLSSLAYFHHGWELDLDFSGIIERAATVKQVEDDTRWVDWERYSSRQDHQRAGHQHKIAVGGNRGFDPFRYVLASRLHLGQT